MNLKGYTRHKANPVIYPNTQIFWQKRVRDEDGRTKYFIQLPEYDFSKYPDVPINTSYEMHVQFNGEQTVNISTSVHTQEDLEKAEEMVEKMFVRMEFEHYE